MARNGALVKGKTVAKGRAGVKGKVVAGGEDGAGTGRPHPESRRGDPQGG